jgi:hypothetical protein
VLQKHFTRKASFDLRIMKDRERLIRATPRLFETFRAAGYSAAFILVDRDDSPCPIAVLDELDEEMRLEARKPISERYLHVCVAVKGLEAWFLADAAAINGVFAGAQYVAPKDTGAIDAGRRLESLWRGHFPTAAFNKIDFAKRIAPKFTPATASQHSRSFDHCWKRLAGCIK